MKILPLESIDFNFLLDQLTLGATFIYPTETCYGLGCDATNQESVKKLFEIKARDPKKPCITLFKNREQLKQYAQLDSECEQKILPFWPGALTVVLPVKPNTNLAPELISKDQTIACRISPHPFLQKLFAYFDLPLVSTSANLAGQANIYTPTEIVHTFAEQNFRPDIFIDAGELPFTPPSTLIHIKEGKIEVLRQGSIIIN